MFFSRLLIKIKYYLAILKKLLSLLMFATSAAVLMSLLVAIFYDVIICLLVTDVFLTSVLYLHDIFYEMRFLPSRYLLIPLNIMVMIAIFQALIPYIAWLAPTVFWPVIIAVATFTFTVMLCVIVLLYNPFVHMNDYDFDDLKMSEQEERALMLKQETALGKLNQYDLSAAVLDEKEKMLLETINIIKTRLRPPEGIYCIITLDPFDPVTEPSIVLFKEYQVNESQWASYSDRGSNIFTFTQEAMDHIYHPATGIPATNHPMNNQEKIFQPRKRTILENGKTITQNTRYRFHTYRLLADGETPLCLELCRLTEELATCLEARNAPKLLQQPSPHIKHSVFSSTESSQEETSNCWKLCFG